MNVAIDASTSNTAYLTIYLTYIILSNFKNLKVKFLMLAVYPSPPDKGAPNLRAHAHLNGITLYASLTRRKVEVSSPRINVKNQVKFALFAVNVSK